MARIMVQNCHNGTISGLSISNSDVGVHIKDSSSIKVSRFTTNNCNQPLILENCSDIEFSDSETETESEQNYQAEVGYFKLNPIAYYVRFWMFR